jgi:acetyltransferase
MNAIKKLYSRNLGRQFRMLFSAGVARRSMRLRLEDGTPLLVRPVRTEDSDALLDMHARLSRMSLFFRYLRVYAPTRTDIEAICGLNTREGLTLVALTLDPTPQVIGMACLMVVKNRLTPTAEPAIVIEDHFQGRGLGRRLFAHLCRLARKRGIAVLHTHVHKENRKMRHILKQLEYPLVEKCHGDMVETEIVLNADANWGWLPPEMAGFSSLTGAECS